VERAPPIDVWDVATFDAELRSVLDARARVIRDYRTESQRLFGSAKRRRCVARPRITSMVLLSRRCARSSLR
jgi:hypothetical protein